MNYHSLNTRLKQKFGSKAYKLALDAGMSCPNRDGTVGWDGCIFCSAGGSGEFAVRSENGIEKNIEAAKKMVSGKISSSGPYIAYFQSYTNTYAPLPQLQKLFSNTIMQKDIEALSIAMRPDCLEPEKIQSTFLF